LSDEEEIRIGDEMADQYLVTDGFDPRDPEQQRIQAYVTRVGTSVAIHAHRRLPYRFHYVPDANLINAFALPGGHVFIGGGMISLMHNEDELAAVLGHELEHVDLRHCAERVEFEARMRKLDLGVASEALSLPISLFKAGYSKELELEADREGTQLAVSAGYSAEGAISMFEAMEQTYRAAKQRPPGSPQEEAERVALETLQGYFESHPAAEERVAQIEQLAEARKWPEREMRSLQPEIAAIFRRYRQPATAESSQPPRILR
jgi:predicted Zn-dependent protease